MKKYSIILILSLGLFFASSCSDFMDYPPPTEISAGDVWTDGILAEAYMFRIYFTFQDAGFAEETLASATDESMFIHGREFRQTMAGAVNDLQLGYIGKTQSGHQWQRLYQSIRWCNDFIANIDAATFDNRDKNQLKGEAFFLRAYFYHRLTRAFGGVPLVTNLTTLQDDPASFQVPRSSYTDCINQVLSDLDQAEPLLAKYTFANTQKGRATVAAVKALRVRVLTDAASDLHDEPTATAHSDIFASYKNKELLFYNKGSRADRWNAAKTAAKNLMDNPLGHALPTFGGDGLSVEDKAQAYWNQFNQDSPDHIFSRYFIFTKDESGTKFSLFNGPAGYHAWGGNVPTQDMVDAYSMADGTPFDWNNPAHKAAPYKNREPRFYACIFYDGAKWIPRPSDYAIADPTGTIETGYYQMNPSDSEAAYWPGMDTREGGGENWNATFTGYYIKKFVNPRDGLHSNRINAVFPFIRLTEVYYDYIEACIELGQLDEAKTYLNQIRHSVGMPDITSGNQAELRKIYQNERRKDFLFEEQRYWDMRRWLIAKGAPGLNSLKGVKVTATLKPGVTLAPGEKYSHDESKWNYTYTVNELTVEPRSFPDKCYFMPIHRDEMNRNLKLIQNPGY